MSRVGRNPVAIPKGVTVAVEHNHVKVKGPKGELSRPIPPEMQVSIEDGEVRVARPSDEGRHRALHGLTRSLINNMVLGVSTGFTKQLEIQGVGYRAEPQASGLRLNVGYSHPVDYPAPQGIKLTVESNTLVTVEGIDKELVGQVAAEIRDVRPPEPYKGKGIRYKDEQVRRKAGKTGGKA
jgi:large subunit ribosomal protein L6